MGGYVLPGVCYNNIVATSTALAEVCALYSVPFYFSMKKALRETQTLRARWL